MRSIVGTGAVVFKFYSLLKLYDKREKFICSSLSFFGGKWNMCKNDRI